MQLEIRSYCQHLGAKPLVREREQYCGSRAGGYVSTCAGHQAWSSAASRALTRSALSGCASCR
jgi:hypothetical protein